MVKPQLYTVIYCRAFGPRRLWSALKCQINYYLNEKKNSICGFHDNRKHFMIEKKSEAIWGDLSPSFIFLRSSFIFHWSYSDMLIGIWSCWWLRLFSVVSSWSQRKENQFGGIILFINWTWAIMMFYTCVCAEWAALARVAWNNAASSWFITP